MAYVLEPDNEQDQKDKEAKYSALFGGDAASQGAPGEVAAAQVKKPASSFVSTDRYLAANKGTVDRMNNDARSALSTQTDALNSNIAKTGADITGKAQAASLAGPAEGTQITPDTVENTQQTALKGLGGTSSLKQAYTAGTVRQGAPEHTGTRNYVTRADAVNNSSSTYGGPSQADVGTAYDSLFSDYSKTKEDVGNARKYGLGSVNKWGAFDSALSNADGGRNVADLTGKLAGTEQAYTDSQKAATDAVNTAASSYDPNVQGSAASKWSDLFHGFDKDQAAKTAADAEASKAAMRKATETYFHNNSAPGMGHEWTSEATRPRGQDILEATEYRPFGNGGAGANVLVKDTGMPREKIARILDSMDDGELQKFLETFGAPTKGATDYFRRPQLVKDYLVSAADRHGVK